VDAKTAKRRELVHGLDLSATTALVVITIIGTDVFLKTARMDQAVSIPLLVLLAWGCWFTSGNVESPPGHETALLFACLFAFSVIASNITCLERMPLYALVQ
jgi:hypothetical protein